MSAKSPGLEAELRTRIERHGSIGFDEFMAAALYDPRHGYYAAAQPRTGRDGDYFTSVSVGPVFGKLLAAQFLEMREHLGNPENFTLVEQGAGDGQLMADVLAVWRGALPRVFIIEPLANLRGLQQKTLADRSDSITWITSEKELPELDGVFFANELLDAFPVKLLARRRGTWFERRVGHDGRKFIFVETAFSGSVPQVHGEAGEFQTEICPPLEPWVGSVAAKLRRGWLFVVDYGHPAALRYHPSRADGSLAAYRNHRRMDNALADPGLQDLTAHVDFSAVATAAESAGLNLSGFTDQHHALAALAENVFPAMPGGQLTNEAAREMRALRQLLHPESMGTCFKFLALSKGVGKPLTAFRFARDPHEELHA